MSHEKSFGHEEPHMDDQQQRPVSQDPEPIKTFIVNDTLAIEAGMKRRARELLKAGLPDDAILAETGIDSQELLRLRRAKERRATASQTTLSPVENSLAPDPLPQAFIPPNVPTEESQPLIAPDTVEGQENIPALLASDEVFSAADATILHLREEFPNATSFELSRIIRQRTKEDLPPKTVRAALRRTKVSSEIEAENVQYDDREYVRDLDLFSGMNRLVNQGASGLEIRNRYGTLGELERVLERLASRRDMMTRYGITDLAIDQLAAHIPTEPNERKPRM